MSLQDSGRASPAPHAAPSADTSILPIVTSQRDRFRARNAELEEVRGPPSLTRCLAAGQPSDAHPCASVSPALLQELRKQFESISELRAEVKSLQADNLKLYEKVRYIGSYREDSSSSASHHAGPSSGAGAMNGGGGGGLGGIGLSSRDEIGRYKDKYDESLNPFEAFKGRVRRLSLRACLCDRA